MLQEGVDPARLALARAFHQPDRQSVRIFMRLADGARLVETLRDAGFFLHPVGLSQHRPVERIGSDRARGGAAGRGGHVLRMDVHA